MILDRRDQERYVMKNPKKIISISKSISASLKYLSMFESFGQIVFQNVLLLLVSETTFYGVALCVNFSFASKAFVN